MKRGDIAGIVLVVLFLGAALLGSLVLPDVARNVNFGFGPEWDCFPAGHGDPVCIKRPAKTE
jgi:hypothetical protein